MDSKVRNKMELTHQDKENILVLLDRVELKGLKEAQVVAALVAKLTAVTPVESDEDSD
jgi:hypothetical protein